MSSIFQLFVLLYVLNGKIYALELDQAKFIEVYSIQNYIGSPEKVNISTCSNLSWRMSQNVRSIKAHNNCARLYSELNCSGTFIELFLMSPSHNDLAAWNFSDKARSVGPCGHPCDDEIIAPIPDEPFAIKVFKHINFLGNSSILSVTDCTLIPTAFVRQIQSVETNGYCVEFYNNANCVAGQNSSIELRNTPYHNNLKLWFIKKYSIAVSHCARKCKVSGNGKEKTKIGELTPHLYLLNSTREKPTEESNALIISPTILAIAIVVTLIFGVCLTAVVVVFIMRRRVSYERTEFNFYEKQIQEFVGGLKLELEGNDGTEAGYSVELLAENVPYDSKYEISRSRIKYDTKAPLGMGEFGIVFKGTLAANEETTVGQSSFNKRVKYIPAAVKTVKPGSGIQCLQSLLKEVKVMLYVGKHENVAYMVGCCTENLRKGEFLVLMEYCSNGSLESYLRKNQKYFRNIVTVALPLKVSSLSAHPRHHPQNSNSTSPQQQPTHNQQRNQKDQVSTGLQ